MATSLRDIPGATRDPVLLRDQRRGGRLRRRKAPALQPAPLAGLSRPPRRSRLFQRRRQPVNKVDLLIVLLALGLAAFFGRALWTSTRVGVEVQGLTDGALLTAEQAERLGVRLLVDPPDRADRARVTINGHETSVEVLPDGVRWVPERQLPEGRHELAVSVPRPLLPDSTFTWSFTVDGTAPAIDIPAILDPVPIDEPVTVTGRVDPDATLFVDGAEVEVDDGVFALDYDYPPAGPIRLEAVDRAGNRSMSEVIVPIRYEPTRSVHVTAAAWDYDPLREGILALIDAGKIDAVELDIKDEGGDIGHRSRVPLANESGAARNMYDLEEAVRTLHDRGVRVIGRLVAFRDPILARYAYDSGRENWVIQLPDGSPHPSYGGFTNFAHPDVRSYNLDLALEAVDAGVDEILFDYIRRPEGSLDQMVFPGLVGTPEDGVIDFLAGAHAELRRAGVPVGASVFGIAADRPWTVGQDVPRMGRHVDYVAPMVYPSLWVPGEYRVDDPVRQPYEIVKRSLADFQEKLEGTGAVIVPWLQDFTLGPTYGEAEVRAQIQAAQDLGMSGFLLWNPMVRYTADALDPLFR